MKYSRDSPTEKIKAPEVIFLVKLEYEKLMNLSLQNVHLFCNLSPVILPLSMHESDIARRWKVALRVQPSRTGVT